MTDERFRGIEELFNAAVNLEPSKRQRFLSSACGADVELRREIERRLLIFDGLRSTVRLGEAGARRPPVGAHEIGIGSKVGKYRITRTLGRGGMGVVYEAWYEDLSKPVALKVLHSHLSERKQSIRRFWAEARAAASIRHPGIVDVVDIDRHGDGCWYIVMELLCGQSLRDRLRSAGPMRESKVVFLARQIASALVPVHARGIVHRDLKPANVFLATEPEIRGAQRAKILDFGIAKIMEAKGSPMTRSGALVGTPPYMSPEQCRGAGGVDHRTDLYSLGVLLFEMLCGRRPFTGEGVDDYIIAHVTSTAPSVRDYNPAVSEAVDALIARLLAKDPAQRFASARDLIIDLEKIHPWLRSPPLGQNATDALAGATHAIVSGLRLIARLPESCERDKVELCLRMGHGPMLVATKGYAAAEVEQNYARASQLCHELPEDDEVFSALWAVWNYTQIQARYREAAEFGERLLGIADRAGDPVRRLVARQALALSLTLLGRYERAKDRLEEALAIYDSEQHKDVAHRFGLEPGMYCHLFMAWVLFAQGYPDGAVSSIETSLAITRSIDHPASRTFALCMSLVIFQARNDVERVRSMAAAAIDLATEYGYHEWVAFAAFMRAWVVAEAAGKNSEDRESGIHGMYKALAEWRSIVRAALPWLHSLLAEQLGRAGKVEEALDVQAEVAPGGSDDCGHYHVPLWKRVRARLLILRAGRDDTEQAVTLLEEVVTAERSRGARCNELVALTDLIEILDAQGTPVHGRLQRLEEIYSSIDEGRDLPFMTRARQVLERAGQRA